MTDYKDIFAKHGYALFEPESIESAIIDALKERKLRYLYGIPILLESSKVDYDLLLKLSKKAGVLKDLMEILWISSGIIRDKRLAGKLRALAKGLRRTSFNVEEFKRAYDDYRLGKKFEGFQPSLNYQLSFLFAKGQIDVLYKVKTGERLTKTEKEYFSRIIKKKLIAIRELYPLAKEILTKE